MGLIGVAALTLLASAGPAAADQLGVDFSPEPGSILLSGAQSAGTILGIEFTLLSSNLTVYSLGTFDGGSAANLPTPVVVDLFKFGTRACIQLRRIVTAANCTPARKFLASLS
jgi:hypothetical protein